MLCGGKDVKNVSTMSKICIQSVTVITAEQPDGNSDLAESPWGAVATFSVPYTRKQNFLCIQNVCSKNRHHYRVTPLSKVQSIAVKSLIIVH